MKTEIMTITPKMAEEFLKNNPMNRVVRDSIVQEYTRQMYNNLWRENTGEAIKFATDNAILDGQHRLIAITKSGKALSFLVIKGLEKDVFPVLDSGFKRTPGDVLHIGGVQNSIAIAAGIRSYYNLRTGRQLTRGAGISSAEIFKIYNNRSQFWNSSYTMASSWYKSSQRILTQGEFLGFFVFFHDINEDDAFNFISSLAEGTGLEKNDPIFLLREKLTFAKMSAKFSLVSSMKIAFIIKSWNAFREKRKMSYLKFNPDIEKYPVAK